MKSNKNKKKKLLAAAAALALIAAVSGTFAWITAQDQRINRVETAAITDGSVTVSEEWEPKPIIPGTEATKKVSVTNSGSVPVFVRVSYEEVLTHLVSKGAVTSSPTAFNPTTATFTSDVAVEYDGDKYTNSANPANDPNFVDITAKVTSGGAALPSGVKVYAKGSVTKDGITGELKTSFDYAMFYEYATGKYQAMDQTVTVVSGNVEGAAVGTWTFDAASLGYRVYAGGYATITKSWAESSLPDADNNPTGYALLGTTGTKYGEAYDYTVGGSLGIAALPGHTPQTAANAPTAAGDVKGVQADRDASFAQAGLDIKYSADITTVATLAASSWVYNSDDGYFYYTTPVASGDTTANLLEALVFNNTVGDAYTNATYDLVVKMEAIQGTEAALSDAAGWNLQNSAGAATTAILAHLASQGA